MICAKASASGFPSKKRFSAIAAKTFPVLLVMRGPEEELASAFVLPERSLPQVFLCCFQSDVWHSLEQYFLVLHLAQCFKGLASWD